MARHSNGKNNYALSGGAIAVLVALLAIIALVLWMLFGRGGSDEHADGGECVSGNLELPVAASDASVGKAIVDAYAKTTPVVRDYCVTPKLVDNVADAAVYIAPNTPVTHQVLANANRTAAVSEPETVATQPVGVAGEAEASAENIDLAAVRFPVGEQPSSSAVVAATLAGGDDQRAIEALTNQRVEHASDYATSPDTYLATAEEDAPEGLVFTPVDAAVEYAAIPLNAGDQVDENQSRAGQDFARSAAKDAQDGDTDGEGTAASGGQPVIDEMVWAAALPEGGAALTGDAAHDQAGQQPADAAAHGPVENTLFLLDTSDAMAPFIQPAKDAIGAAATTVAGKEKQVGLWNYSSPINEGVTRGYRVNVPLTFSAEEVNVAVQRFATGGVPQTREALLAATRAAADARDPMRVVLVTTGTADGGNDEEFANALKPYLDQGADIAVVHVGDAQQDAGVQRVASSQQQVSNADELAQALDAAIGTH